LTDNGLTVDRIRLLILISRFSNPSQRKDEEERWFKEIPLISIISWGIWMGAFKRYDLAPTLVEYMGEMRFATVSKEGEDDVNDLRRMRMVERLKLATKQHFHVSAYRITDDGMKVVMDADPKHVAAIDKLTKCPKCKGDVEVTARPDSPFIICRDCDYEERIPIFDIEEVPYVTSPEFTEIWNPPE
jgi:hypothetical protein